MTLTVTIHEADGVSVLTLEGRLLFGENISALREKVKELVAAGKRKIVLNLGNVPKIDSVGLGVLVAAHHSALARGASLRLCNLPPQVKAVLQVTKLLGVFDVSDTEADAVRTLSK